MPEIEDWDWTPGKKELGDYPAWAGTYAYMEETYVSPDGEKIAAIVKTGEQAYSVCVNGRTWDSAFEKIWHLRFTPDGRPVALVSDTAMWTVAVDGTAWENWYEFAWNPLFSRNGSRVTVAAQKEFQYFAVTNDVAWQNGFLALNHLAADPSGNNTAAVVQDVSFAEADIAKFQEGCFTVAVNGNAWDTHFVNAWGLAFSADGSRVAAETRTSLYDYTIAVDGRTWEKRFSCVWAPRFHPSDGSLSAPVKVAGGWSLARDDELIWQPRYVQLWHHLYSPDGLHIAAIVSPEFGKWTLAEDDRPWRSRFDELVTGAVYSPAGDRLACVGKAGGRWYIAVDDRVWNTPQDMAWQPVFSPDGAHVAALVEKNGRYTVMVDQRSMDMEFSRAWQPVFSPDARRLMVRGILPEAEGGHYGRFVLEVDKLVS